MTMPKFEPVAWLFKGLKPGYRTEFASIDPCESQTWPTDNGMVWNKSELYTSDQLAGAYEAGKRDASEDLEQAAFEKWLYDKCPSGDVESVQRQWLESYEYAELAGKRNTIPEGYMLAPKEPTEEMIDLWIPDPNADPPMTLCKYSAEALYEIYKAMLAAAPKGEE